MRRAARADQPDHRALTAWRLHARDYSSREIARALGKEFSLRVEPRFQGIADASPGVIVIVTKEYADRQSKG